MQPPPYSPLSERTPHHPSPSCRHTPIPIRILRLVVWLSPTITIFASVAFRMPALWMVIVALVLLGTVI